MTDLPLAAAPALAKIEADDRVRCFLLGARIHDHVADMLRAIEEVDEAKSESDPLARDARQWFHDLDRMLAEEVGDARQLGCLPSDVLSLLEVARSGGPPSVGADNARVRDNLYAISVKLGDPPLLRNLRRIDEARSQPPKT